MERRLPASLPFLLVAVGAVCGVSLPALAQVSVLTRNYDNQRTGANTSETILNASNVNPAQFGKVFTLRVDDQVYAGILYVPNLTIATGIHNVIFVETVNNTVYAFDADALGPPLWQRNFNGSGRPTRNTEVGQACGTYRDYIGNIGIVGTPVIDGPTQTMYFVTRTVEDSGTVQRLRAIDILTGDDRPGSPRIIQASVPGTVGMVVFNPLTQNQRAGLGLSQGVVYIAWSSFCDTQPYHGWMMTYDATTLTPMGVFNTTPNGSMAAIWMSGAAPAFDADGNTYVSTGNGTWNGIDAFGQSLLKLAPGSLAVVDFFTPSNYQSLNAADLDFGSGAPVMLPGTTRLATGGKEGKFYLLETTDLGQWDPSDAQIPQSFQAVDTSIRPGGTHNIHNTTNVWNSPQGLNVYVWGENDFLHAYRFNAQTGILSLPAFANGSVLPPMGMPGGHLTISANGSQPGTGIVWATLPRNGDANQLIVPGQLVALNAETLAFLWSSTAPGDDPLNFAKGSPPVVANGKVYVASQSSFVSVYGLRKGPPASQNLALNRPATGSEPCQPGQTPNRAFNGSSQAGPNDKWCSLVPTPFLQVDLGADFSLARFVVQHAGAGGESFAGNTRDYLIQVSLDGTHFQTVTNATGNFLSITTHDVVPVVGRFVRLVVRGPRPASIYELEVYGSPAPATPDFLVSASPATQTVIAGANRTFAIAITPFGGFADTVALSVSGLPAGATANFEPPSIGGGSGTSTLHIGTEAVQAFGSFALAVTASSGAITQTTIAYLSVNRNPEGAVLVDLSRAFGLTGITSDGTPFAHGGLDGGGSAYSGNLLGTEQTFTGIPFALGLPDVSNAIAGPVTLPLTVGQFASLGMLATAINGNAPGAIFTIRYTDGTIQPVTQDVSDWYTPQGFAGEDIAVAMGYRNDSDGTRDERPFNLYAYFLPLDPTKTVKTLRVTQSRVRVLGLTLLPARAAGPDFALSASPASFIAAPGSTVMTTITTTPLRGFEGAVRLALSALPAGVTGSLVRNTPLESTLTLSISPSAPLGRVEIIVTGRALPAEPGGPPPHTARIVLDIRTP
jgi:outer membrane protein assembly factor BamB